MGNNFLTIFSPFFFHSASKDLCNFNILIIQTLSEKLKFTTKFFRSHSLNIEGERSERLLKICHGFNCKNYLSPIGSKKYLEEDCILTQSHIHVHFQNFLFPKYTQKGTSHFQAFLSCIDLIANLGYKGTRELIFNGWKPIFSDETQVSLSLR